MKLLGKTALRSLFTLALLAPAATFAAPITYDITDITDGSFSASWLHAAESSFADGYFMNGDKASISGTLTIDWIAGTASGSVSTDDAADTDFGGGSGDWLMNFTGATLPTSAGGTFGDQFFGGDDLLIALDYELFLDSASSPDYTGTFYFADRTFAGAANSGRDSNEIFLWGNNWFNEFGDEEDKNTVDFALGIDLYGIAAVPEPTSLFLLGSGLLGLSLRRRRKTA